MATTHNAADENWTAEDHRGEVDAATDWRAYAERVLIETGRAGANHDTKHPLRPLWEAARAAIKVEG